MRSGLFKRLRVMVTVAALLPAAHALAAEEAAPGAHEAPALPQLNWGRMTRRRCSAA